MILHFVVVATVQTVESWEIKTRNYYKLFSCFPSRETNGIPSHLHKLYLFFIWKILSLFLLKTWNSSLTSKTLTPIQIVCEYLLQSLIFTQWLISPLVPPFFFCDLFKLLFIVHITILYNDFMILILAMSTGISWLSFSNIKLFFLKALI